MAARSGRPCVLVPLVALAAAASCAPPPIVAPAVTATLLENPAAGAAIASVTATGGTGEYTFALKSEAVPGVFELDGATGAITVKSPGSFDFEANPVLIGEVDVESGDLVETVTVTVNLTDDLRETVDGAAAWYRLDGDATDALGDLYDGTTTATAVADRKGTADGALEFGVEGETMTSANFGEVPLSSGSFSVAAWIHIPGHASTDARTTSAQYRMLSKRSVCNTGQFFDIAYSNREQYGDLLGVEVRSDSTGLSHSPSVSVNGVPVDAWFHFVAVIDADARKSTIYVNGAATTPPVPYDWTANEAKLGPLAGPVGVGISPCITGSDVRGFAGRLDDLILFDRALTAAEAAALAAY